MENLDSTLQLVLPLFLIILIGYGLKEIKLLPASFADQSSRLLFYVILPILFVQDLWSADLSQGYPPALLLVLVLSTGFSCLLAFLIGKALGLEGPQLPSFVHSSFRSNFVYIGYALLRLIFKEVPSTVSLSFLVILGLFNFVASFLYLKGGKGQKPLQVLAAVLKGLFNNPLNIGLILGLALNKLGIPQVQLLSRTLSMIASIASPLALLSIGVAVDFKLQKRFFKAAGIAALLKLLLSPLIGLGLGLLFKVPVDQLLIVFIIFGTPTALNTYAIDREMGGSQELVATAILVSTLLSLLTLTLFLFVFMNAGWI